MVKIIDDKICYTKDESGILRAAPGSNVSKQIKRKVKRLKEELKRQGKPIKYGQYIQDFEQ